MSRPIVPDVHWVSSPFDGPAGAARSAPGRLLFWWVSAFGLSLLFIPLSRSEPSPARTMAVVCLVIALALVVGRVVSAVLPAVLVTRETGRVAVVLGLVMAVVPHLLFESNGDAEPGRGAAPADPAAPLGTTRTEAAILARYKEPAVEALATTVAPVAVPTPTTGAALLPIPEVSDEVFAQARRLYALRCISCHGATGDGKGAAAEAITPKPRDYTDMEWQKTVTNERLADVIVKGGAAMGGSYMMPPSPDLKRKPELTKGLVALVRRFAAK